MGDRPKISVINCCSFCNSLFREPLLIVPGPWMPYSSQQQSVLNIGPKERLDVVVRVVRPCCRCAAHVGLIAQVPKKHLRRELSSTSLASLRRNVSSLKLTEPFTLRCMDELQMRVCAVQASLGSRVVVQVCDQLVSSDEICMRSTMIGQHCFRQKTGAEMQKQAPIRCSEPKISFTFVQLQLNGLMSRFRAGGKKMDRQ